jgi:hypothetical protein
LYSQLNDALLDLCGTMPLSRYPQTAVRRTNVRGLMDNPMPKFTFKKCVARLSQIRE